MPRLLVRQELSAQGRLYSFDYVDRGPPPATHSIPGLRLLADILIGPDSVGAGIDTRARVHAIIDTGAAISLIPHRFWTRLRPGELERFSPAGLPPGETFRRSNILGQPYTFEYGRLHVGVIDTEGRRLRAVPVIGQLLQEADHPLDRPVFGLSESILTGRTLRRHYSARFPFEQEWWLQEA